MAQQGEFPTHDHQDVRPPRRCRDYLGNVRTYVLRHRLSWLSFVCFMSHGQLLFLYYLCFITFITFFLSQKDI